MCGLRRVNLIYREMKAETPYIHLHERKRTWTPVQVSAGTLLDGGEEVVQRALALRCLEIPVGDFIADAMKGDLPDIKGCRELLESNVKDEINHDIALDFAAKAHKISPRFEAEAERIKKAWLELDRHPVLKAVVLERSVFFVLLPIFRFLGDTGLRTTSADISETSKPTSQPTPSSAKSSVLSLTKSSISLGELRLLGCFNPSKGKTLLSICRQTSGWQVQIASTPVAKQKG